MVHLCETVNLCWLPFVQAQCKCRQSMIHSESMLTSLSLGSMYGQTIKHTQWICVAFLLFRMYAGADTQLYTVNLCWLPFVQARLQEELGKVQQGFQESKAACESFESDIQKLTAALEEEKQQHQQVGSCMCLESNPTGRLRRKQFLCLFEDFLEHFLGLLGDVLEINF